MNHPPPSAPDRTLDAGRCISYLTIELKGEIPADLRSLVNDWVFGCDICQMVCPWNRFAPAAGDEAFVSRERLPQPDLMTELEIDATTFGQKFSRSPVRRSRHGGYLRNVAVALGNVAGPEAIPALQTAADSGEPLVAEHAAWAIQRIRARPRVNA